MRLIVLAAGIAGLVSLLGTPMLIRFLRRHGYSQAIRESTDDVQYPAHEGKAGTPSMGGLAIIGGLVIGYAGTHLLFWIPPSATGLLALYLTIGLGMVGMAGVVVNDAIVLVSFVNNLRAEGMPLTEAIVQGARKRVRPILLTSVTTVLGMAPVIYGIGGYEPFVAPAAIVLAYGLVFATFLTLLVVPCMYSLGADLKRFFARSGRRAA